MSKVSVIIPTKNREHLLRITLGNVLGQTLKPHEVIVVDDGSSDGTRAMIENEFSASVQYVQNRGRGPGAARNTGFNVSTGQLIQFFDSDDLMTCNKLEVQANLLCSSRNADLVYGPYVTVEQSGNDWKQLDVIHQFKPLPERPLHLLVAEGWCAITQACMLRRSVIERAGPWREDLMPHEDKEYWYRLGKITRTALHENETCIFYRQHRQQITDLHIKELERTRDAIRALDLIISQMKEDRSFLPSRIVCQGIRAGYVKYMNELGQHDPKNSFTETLYYNLYRVMQKLGRIKTGTNWQPFHGVIDSTERFNNYKAMIKTL